MESIGQSTTKATTPPSSSNGPPLPSDSMDARDATLPPNPTEIVNALNQPDIILEPTDPDKIFEGILEPPRLPNFTFTSSPRNGSPESKRTAYMSLNDAVLHVTQSTEPTITISQFEKLVDVVGVTTRSMVNGLLAKRKSKGKRKKNKTTIKRSSSLSNVRSSATKMLADPVDLGRTGRMQARKSKSPVRAGGPSTNKSSRSSDSPKIAGMTLNPRSGSPESRKTNTADEVDSGKEDELGDGVRRPAFPLSVQVSDSDAVSTLKVKSDEKAGPRLNPGSAIQFLTPPVPILPLASPAIDDGKQSRTGLLPDSPSAIPARDSYDINKPTCSLNLVCYRGGDRGCVLVQINAILESRFANLEDFKKALTADPRLIDTDQALLYRLHKAYRSEMCSFWRRIFSLKTHTGIRLLAYSPSNRPTVVPMDDFVLQEMFYAYRHPHTVKSETSWIEWVFKLRQPNKRHALEFVEGWNSSRIVIAATIPWLISCLVGVVWSAMGGNTQTAFTVAGFILTSGTVVLALLAVISGIESSARGYTSVG